MFIRIRLNKNRDQSLGVNKIILYYMKEVHRSYRWNFFSCEKKAWIFFRPVRNSNPWPLRYQCSALPIKLTSELGAGHELVRIILNPWKDDDEVMNIWKPYMWTAGWKIIWKKIIAVRDATLTVAKESRQSLIIVTVLSLGSHHVLSFHVLFQA